MPIEFQSIVKHPYVKHLNYLCTIIMHSFNSHYQLYNHIFEQVVENPYIGVAIHENLKWANHRNKISNKANSLFGLIQRNLTHANRDLRELAYISPVRSILEYSFTAWDLFYQKDIDRLEKLLQKAATFVFTNHKAISSVTDMLSKLG